MLPLKLVPLFHETTVGLHLHKSNFLCFQLLCQKLNFGIRVKPLLVLNKFGVINLQHLKVTNRFLRPVFNLFLLHPVDSFDLLKFLHEVGLPRCDFILESLFSETLLSLDCV